MKKIAASLVVQQKQAYLILSFLLFITISMVSQAQAESDENKFKKFRVGLGIAAGGGFDQMDMFETNKGTISKLSPGGGVGGGLYLGYFFTQSLELSIYAGSQESSLSQELDNASASVSRGVFRITPKYIYSFNDKHSMTLGGGISFYSNCKMDGDGSELAGGGHNIFTYGNEKGIHVLSEYQYKFSNKWSLSAGLIFYHVAYNDLKKFEADSNTVPVSLAPDECEKLNGNGIDLLMGFYYHF